MELMRKLRDEGKFQNSMLAEIERDELLTKMTEQVNEIQNDLEVRIRYKVYLNSWLLEENLGRFRRG